MLRAVKNKLTGELCVCGFNAVSALCRVHPERVKRLFFARERAPAFGEICKSLASAKKPYRMVEADELEALSKSSHHQGAVAMADIPQPALAAANDVESWIANKRKMVLLDDVGNSHNLGAIARSAAFFGFHGMLILDSGKSSRISTSAYRVAEGGFEFLDIYQTDDLEAVLGPFKAVLPLIGADHRGKIAIDDEKALPPKGKGIVIAFGNEEEGLSRTTRSLCAALVRIPGKGSIESLNVAQSAAVFLSRFA
jgi:TrmH RNA methyltransferase